METTASEKMVGLVMSAAVDLPPPDVNVTSSDAGGEYAVNVFISRRTADQTPIGRSYAGTGTSRDAAVKQVVEKIVADSYSAEWIPRKTP
jgi:hypothetical protein